MLNKNRIGLLLKNLKLETLNIHKNRIYFEGITRVYGFCVNAEKVCNVLIILYPFRREFIKTLGLSAFWIVYNIHIELIKKYLR